MEVLFDHGTVTVTMTDAAGSVVGTISKTFVGFQPRYFGVALCNMDGPVATLDDFEVTRLD